MNILNMPGFTAEASIFQSTSLYVAASVAQPMGSVVIPQKWGLWKCAITAAFCVGLTGTPGPDELICWTAWAKRCSDDIVN
jgi:hypothetical protein